MASKKYCIAVRFLGMYVENMSLTQLQETVLIRDSVGSYKRY